MGRDDFDFPKLLLDEVVLIVESAAQNGGEISLRTEAEKLLARYPTSPMLVSQIEAMIGRLAVQRRLIVRLG